MSISFKPNISPKLSAPVSGAATSTSLKKDELSASGVNVLIPENAKQEASPTKTTSSTANTAIKKTLSASKSSSQTSSSGAQTADANNSTGVPNSGTGGESRFGDLVKNGGQGLQSEIDKSRADTDSKIKGDTIKDPASETATGGGSGAFSLPGTGAGGGAVGPGAVGANYGVVNNSNNFGNQNQSFGGVQNGSFESLPNVTTPAPEVTVPRVPEPSVIKGFTGSESLADIPQ